jgi:hypothetical protein
VWEALYLGVIPVVERSPLTEHFRTAGLPLTLVDDWGDVDADWLAEQHERLRGSSANLAPLRLSHYADLIAAASPR